MLRRIAALAVLTLLITSPAAAFDDSGHFSRQLVCISPGDDVTMELFLPNSVVFGKGTMDNPKKPVIGYYALNLEKLGKGKPLEPVKVWKDAKNNVLVVDQYTRGLPLARVPLGGGVVDFDDRFGQGARCKPYGDTREDEYGVEFPVAPPPKSQEKGTDVPEAK